MIKEVESASVFLNNNPNYTGTLYSTVSDVTYTIVNGVLHSENDYPSKVSGMGVKLWHKEGALHRIGGPAVQHALGSEEWFQNGVRHREDGPAYVTKSVKEWWVHGKKHRLDGPAIEVAGKIKPVYQYFLDDKAYATKEDWLIATREYKLEGFLNE